MSGKEDVVTGLITVSAFGVNTVMASKDLVDWGTALLSMAPLILIIFLIWRMYKLDAQHKECTNNQAKTQEQLILMYRALQDGHVRKQLPPEQVFVDNSFNLADHPAKGN